MPLKKYKKIFYLILIASFFSLSGFSFYPKKAEAWWGFGDTVVEVGKNLFTNLETTILENLQYIKDNILDGIAWSLVNNMIEKIADSTVDWINTGFEGGPGFITNFDSFLEDVGGQTLGDFIAGSPLAFLCSPFSLDIKIAIALQFGSKREARCTLSEAFDNVNTAIDDLGNNWSWDQWSVLSQSQNNAFGAYAAAYQEITLKMAGAQDKAITKGNWGGGLLDFKSCETDVKKEECRTIKDTLGDKHKICETVTVPGQCTTHTPGSLIESTLADTLTSGTKRLMVADEINEIVGALLNQLLNSVLGSGGLLNSNPGGENNKNFSDIPEKTIQEIKDNMISPAIVIENNYKDWKEKSLSLVELTKAYLEALINCWESYTGVGATPPLAEKEVENKITAAQLIITDILNPLWETLDSEITVTKNNITTLKELLARLPATGSVKASEVQSIVNNFNALDLHNTTDVAKAEIAHNGTVIPNMNKIITDVLTESTICTAGEGIFLEP